MSKYSFPSLIVLCALAACTDSSTRSTLTAPDAGQASLAIAGRASGHIGFNFGAPTIGLLSERYSFTALSTDPATFGANGQFELMLTAATGVEQKFHGDVICMDIVGNTARMAGQLTKVWINNVQRPITGATHVIWTVQDNGEGQGITDFGSPMFFNNAANAQQHCAVGFTPPTFSNQEGNVQVQP
ncbi:MAG TPA: hypothetical protein VEB19_03545 [Gemmatimonadaceae bacterium]|nr:hypothetical protein [Gemmatimonadaceae bacterium]